MFAHVINVNGESTPVQQNALRGSLLVNGKIIAIKQYRLVSLVSSEAEVT